MSNRELSEFMGTWRQWQLDRSYHYLWIAQTGVQFTSEILNVVIPMTGMPLRHNTVEFIVNLKGACSDERGVWYGYRNQVFNPESPGAGLYPTGLIGGKADYVGDTDRGRILTTAFLFDKNFDGTSQNARAYAKELTLYAGPGIGEGETIELDIIVVASIFRDCSPPPTWAGI